MSVKQDDKIDANDILAIRAVADAVASSRSASYSRVSGVEKNSSIISGHIAPLRDLIQTITAGRVVTNSTRGDKTLGNLTGAFTFKSTDLNSGCVVSASQIGTIVDTLAALGKVSFNAPAGYSGCASSCMGICANECTASCTTNCTTNCTTSCSGQCGEAACASSCAQNCAAYIPSGCTGCASTNAATNRNCYNTTCYGGCGHSGDG